MSKFRHRDVGVTVARLRNVLPVIRMDHAPRHIRSALVCWVLMVSTCQRVPRFPYFPCFTNEMDVTTSSGSECDTQVRSNTSRGLTRWSLEVPRACLQVCIPLYYSTQKGAKVAIFPSRAIQLLSVVCTCSGKAYGFTSTESTNVPRQKRHGLNITACQLHRLHAGTRNARPSQRKRQTEPFSCATLRSSC